MNTAPQSDLKPKQASRGKLVVCPYCSRMMLINNFKKHLYGLPSDYGRKTYCREARKLFPNGMKYDEYKSVLRKVSTSPSHAFKRQDVTGIDDETARPVVIRNEKPKDGWISTYECPEVEVPLPDVKSPGVNVIPGNKVYCGVCDQLVAASTSLKLPCCHHQVVCLWCIMKTSTNPGGIICKFCKADM